MDQKDIRRTRILIFFTYKVFHFSLLQQLKKQNKTNPQQQTSPDNSAVLPAFQQDSNC